MKVTVLKSKNDQMLLDWSLGMGQLPPANKRVQIKIPDVILKKLDELYPEIDRSRVVTQLVLQAVVMKLRFLDRPDLGEMVESDQSEMDEMWDYLEKRDAGI